jgi:hypothetical protein
MQLNHASLLSWALRMKDRSLEKKLPLVEHLPPLAIVTVIASQHLRIDSTD